MDINSMINSFAVFNINAVSSLIYMFSENWSVFLMIAGAIATTVMSIMSRTDTIIREEQRIL